MKPRWRRDKVPDEVKQALVLQPGERVMSVCRSDGACFLAATDRALYRVTPPTSQRLRWDLIDHAAWQPPLLVLQVRDGDDDTLTALTWQADQDGDLPAVVRDRVTSSILVNSRIAVPGGTARVVARRNADTGQLQWRLVFGAGVDANDPQVQQATEAELVDLRSRLGL